MNTDRLAESPCGELIPIQGGYFAYVPHPLPQEVTLDSALIRLLDEASRAVGTLQGVGETLPNPDLLVQSFLRREAVLSSRIEGTRTLISDLVLYEVSKAEQDPKGDAQEVLNYVHALGEGIRLLDTLPISTRFLNQLHSRLLSGTRGEDRRLGQLRQIQVIIGGDSGHVQDARFIPPPPQMVPELLADWERFVNAELEMPVLVQCALMHYQFETIHPYEDGNGRIGRLLIGLMLHAAGVLTTPLLSLSGYLERNRDAYMDHLLQVSITGDWKPWIGFFLQGVADQAKDALIRSRRVRKLHDDYRARLVERGESANAFRMIDLLFQTPMTTPARATAELGITRAGSRALLDRLAQLGILRVLPRQRPRFYIAEEILDAIQT